MYMLIDFANNGIEVTDSPSSFLHIALITCVVTSRSWTLTHYLTNFTPIERTS